MINLNEFYDVKAEDVPVLTVTFPEGGELADNVIPASHRVTEMVLDAVLSTVDLGGRAAETLSEELVDAAQALAHALLSEPAREAFIAVNPLEALMAAFEAFVSGQAPVEEPEPVEQEQEVEDEPVFDYAWQL